MRKKTFIVSGSVDQSKHLDWNILFILLFLFVSMCSAQDINRTNNWFFGNEFGLEFSRTSIVQNFQSSMVATEATAVMSDTNGQLLFYTDGSKVYNRNHQLMINGSGLLGRRQSSQPVIIVPHPTNKSRYYIFTIGSFYGDLREGPFNAPATDHGLNFSIVDFSNNINGEVIEKNQHLLDHSALKISAIKNCSDNSYWLTVLSTDSGQKGEPYNTFYSFKINNQGVTRDAVKSQIDVNISDPRGTMKFSPNGKKLAAANVTSRLLISNFDSASGMVSNVKILSIKDLLTSAIAEWPYSVEFSIDNKFLYTGTISESDDSGNPSRSGLVQYYLGDTELNNIAQNKTILRDNEAIFGNSLQLGRNGKIYRAYSSYDNRASTFLGVIDSPGSRGMDANYQHDAIELSNRFLGFRRSLPNFIPSFFSIENLVQASSDSKEIMLCQNSQYSFETEFVEGADYKWYHNGDLLENETTHVYTIDSVGLSDLGFYEVVVSPNNDSCTIHKEALIVEVVPLPYLPDNLVLSQCSNESPESTRFNLNELFSNIDFEIEDFTVKFFHDDPGLNEDAAEIDNESVENFSIGNQTELRLFIKLINKLNCSITTSFLIRTRDTELPLLESIVLCDTNDSSPDDGLALFNAQYITENLILNHEFGDGIQLSYYLSQDDAILEKNVLIETHVRDNSIIWVRGETAFYDCQGISPLKVRVNTIPRVNLENTSRYLCVNPLNDEVLEPISLGKDLGLGFTYSWTKNGEVVTELPVVEIKEPGIYKLSITDNASGCSRNYESVEISISSIPVNHPDWLIVQKSSPFSRDNEIEITARGLGNTTFVYQLDEGIQSPVGQFKNLSNGTHTITISNEQGCDAELTIPFQIVGFPKFFTPNGDGYNDFWVIKDPFLDLGKTDILIYDRYGKNIAKILPNEKGWDGLYNGQPMRSDDYWFELVLKDGSIYRNHFALVR